MIYNSVLMINETDFLSTSKKTKKQAKHTSTHDSDRISCCVFIKESTTNKNTQAHNTVTG